MANVEAAQLLAERVSGEWDHIKRVLALSRGEDWEQELPSEVGVLALGELSAPGAIIFRFLDVGLDYMRVPADDGVLECNWGDADEDGGVVLASVYAQNGELLRTVPVELGSPPEE